MSRSTVNVSFEIEGIDMGKGVAPLHPSEGTAETTWSTAYTCRMCGRIWARVKVLLQPPHPQHRWHFLDSLCPNHTSTTTVAGGLWRGYQMDINNAMPEEVLKRELLLHCDFYERCGNGLY